MYVSLFINKGEGDFLVTFIRYHLVDSDQWDRIVESMQGTVFSMTSLNIEFMMDYSLSSFLNESFIMCIDNVPVGIAVLCIEKDRDNKNSVSWSGRDCPAPYIISSSLRQEEKNLKLLMKEIDRITQEQNIKKICFAIDPLVNPHNDRFLYNYNYLIKESYRGKYNMTQIIDLRLDEKILYNNIRKNHKRNINKGKNYSIEIYDKNSVTLDMIEKYKNIYEIDAGKVTRNSELYMHYYKFIKSGKGYIAFARNDQEYIAVLIATCLNNTAYYSSYAELEEKTNHISVGHVLHWELIKKLKKDGVEFYNIGEQVFEKSEKVSEKEVNISLFKRGFGGYTVSSFSGEKNY